MTAFNQASDLVPARLRCEALTGPLGITAKRPRLGWIVQSEARRKVQSAYQVIAATSLESLDVERADLWDSGKVASDETIEIEYAGQPLTPPQRGWWKVRVWDEADLPSPWSAPAVFGAGLGPRDWAAEWIGCDQTRAIDLPPAPFEGATWIWCAGAAAVPSEGIFRGTLILPEEVQIAHAEIALSVAGRFRFFWGQEQFGVSDDDSEPWRRPYLRDMTERLQPGLNQVVIKAERIDQEPAGTTAILTQGGRIIGSACTTAPMTSPLRCGSARTCLARSWPMAGSAAISAGTTGETPTGSTRASAGNCISSTLTVRRR